MTNKETFENPVFFARRFASILYDWMLLIAIILVAVTVITLPVDMILGKGSMSNLLEQFFWKTLFQAYLVAVGILFYAGFWKRAGQTLGMKVWKIRLVRLDGVPMNWQNTLLRVFWAVVTNIPLGLGILSAIFDKNGLTIYDKLSGTRLQRTENS